MRAKDQLLAAAAQSPVLQDVYVEGLSPAPQVELVVDREKAAALGVTFEEINNLISTNLGSAYINDFPNRGRMQQVIVQADRNTRTVAEPVKSTLSCAYERSAGTDVVLRDGACVSR